MSSHNRNIYCAVENTSFDKIQITTIELALFGENNITSISKFSLTIYQYLANLSKVMMKNCSYRSINIINFVSLPQIRKQVLEEK